MKKKILMIGLMAAALCLTAGCQGKQEEAAPLEAEIVEDEVPVKTEDNGTQDSKTEDINADTEEDIPEKEDTEAEDTDTKAKDIDTEAKTLENNTENNSGSQSVKAELSGMVKSVGDSKVTVGQIFTMDMGDGGLVAVSSVSEDGDENILSIYFNDGAQYEFNIIRDGGGNVESREGSFEDIKTGMILHMTGNWDGNDFYADYISINEVK